MAQKYKLQKLVAVRRHPDQKVNAQYIEVIKQGSLEWHYLAGIHNAKDGSESHAYAQVMAMVPELVETLRRHRDYLDLGDIAFFDKYGFNASDVMPKTRALLSKVNQYFEE